MSQVVTPGPPPPAPAPNSVLPHAGPAHLNSRAQVSWFVEVARGAFAGTPGRLRLIALGVIFGSLIAGFGGAWALNERHAALDEAKATTQHLVLLQNVQTNLWQADAVISNTFLQGGLENTTQLNRFYTSVKQASADLAGAARASAADGRVLSQANVALVEFSGYIESARANNRQGDPVSINYLKDATASLDTDVIAKVNQRAEADQRSIDGSLDRSGRATLWLLLAVVLGGGLLIWSQIVLARTTRRYLNLPAAGASLALLVVLVASAAAMAGVQGKASDVRTGAYADTVQLADARVAAFDAKATESLGLVSRGSGGGESEQHWQDQIAIAKQLPAGNTDALTSLAAYEKAHQQIRALDDDGDWDGAVASAVAAGPGTANDSFEAYVAATRTSLTSTTATALDGLNRNGWLLVLLAVVLALVGVAAAIAAWFGVSLRMGEYR